MPVRLAPPDGGHRWWGRGGGDWLPMSPAAATSRRPTPPKGAVTAPSSGTILKTAMFRVPILRASCAALLAAALVLPALVEALDRGPSGSAECRCSNHACCTAKRGAASPAGPACPLLRAGLACAPSRPAKTPELRAGCGCHQRGEHAALTAPKAALLSARLAGLAPPPQTAARLSVPQTSPSILRFTPDPPPPRSALRSA